MIRVLIVDDQRPVRAGLRMLFDAEADIEVVGEAAGGEEAVRLAARSMPEVVLMDLRMPGVDGITATRQILSANAHLRVLVLTTFNDDEHLYPALEAGACGFLGKDTPPPELLNGVRRAAAGESPFSREALNSLVRQAVKSRTAPEAPPPTITAREQEVLMLVAAGHANAEIAKQLHVSVTTVKSHVKNMMAKTGAANRVQLAMLAHRY